jgi:hypothetical protein
VALSLPEAFELPAFELPVVELVAPFCAVALLVVVRRFAG